MDEEKNKTIQAVKQEAIKGFKIDLKK